MLSPLTWDEAGLPDQWGIANHDSQIPPCSLLGCPLWERLTAVWGHTSSPVERSWGEALRPRPATSPGVLGLGEVGGHMGADVPAPAKPSDDCSLSQHLNCNLRGTLSQTTWLSWSQKCLSFKLLIWGDSFSHTKTKWKLIWGFPRSGLQGTWPSPLNLQFTSSLCKAQFLKDFARLTQQSQNFFQTKIMVSWAIPTPQKVASDPPVLVSCLWVTHVHSRTCFFQQQSI